MKFGREVLFLIMLILAVVGVINQVIAQGTQPVTLLGNYGKNIVQEEVYTPAPDLNYLLFMPGNSDAMVDGKFPLLISLSGIGERGSDLSKVKNDGLPSMLDGWNTFPFIVASPQCPLTTEWYWDRTDTLIRRMVDNLVSTLPVDPQRIYLTGYSMGGIGSWDTASRHPGLFAAVLPIAARKEPGPSQCNMSDIPVWAFHGSNDPIVPFAMGQGAINIFRSCGGKAIFTVYQGVGHVSWPQTYANMDIYEWMLKQSRQRTQAVAANQHFVYQGVDHELVTLKYDNSSQLPERVSRLPVNQSLLAMADVEISGQNFLAAAGDSSFSMINLDDPASPVVHGSFPYDGVALSTMAENVWLARGDAGICGIDFSDPLSPALLTILDTLGHCYDLFADSTILYVAAGTKAHFLDISNPTAPVYSGSIAASGSDYRAITAKDGYVLIGDHNSGLQIFDVQNVASPTLTGQLNTGKATSAIRIKDDHAYLASTDNGLKIVDVSNPAAPVEISSWPSPGRAAAMAFGEITASGGSQHHAFIADYSAGVRAINISDPALLTESGFLQVAPHNGGGFSFGKAYRSAVRDQIAYIAYGWDGLKIVDVNDPQQPQLLGELNTPGDARDVKVENDFAYVADWDPGLRVINISDPQQPQEVRALRIGRTRQLALANAFAYVAASDSGLVVLDLANPADPVVSAADTTVFGQAIATNGQSLLLADNQRLILFDISDPAYPVRHGASDPFTTGCEGLALHGQNVFVPDGDSLRIYDISNPDSLLQVSVTSLAGSGFDVAVQYPYAGIAAGESGLQIFDISDETDPYLAGVYSNINIARGITIANQLLFLSEEKAGLSIYRFDGLTALEDPAVSLPQTLLLMQNYPNPFNGTTVIDYYLPAAGEVDLAIYNLLGQEIKTLVRSGKRAGTHTIRWDGRDANGNPVASGVYFYRLKADDLVKSKKLLLLQ